MTLSLLIHLADFIVMWSLPVLFFEKKDGRLNLQWFLTAMPFAVTPALWMLVHLGYLAPLPLGSAVATALKAIGVALALASIGLIAWTWRTHRVPLSLWHMENDAPTSLVTSGPYAFIRHPFYTSFLLGILGAACSAPHLFLVLTFGYAAVILDRTAAREEARLSTSQFGLEYRVYVQRTGRFVPWRTGR